MRATGFALAYIMTTELSPPPSFFARVAIAFGSFFRALGSPRFAAGARELAAGATVPALAPPAETSVDAEPRVDAKPPPPALHRAPTDAALQLLSLFQREGRLIDFLQEDVSAFSDADIGAAARVVHQGCKRALEGHVKLERVRTESEGSSVTLPTGFDARTVRLTGNVSGEAPFTGTLQHAGWRATEVELPALTEEHDVRVLAPAEVEL